MLRAQFYVREDPRLSALLLRYPWILERPPYGVPPVPPVGPI